MSFCCIRFYFRLDMLGVSLEEDFLFCHVAFPTHLVDIFCLISWCAHVDSPFVIQAHLFRHFLFLCPAAPFSFLSREKLMHPAELGFIFDWLLRSRTVPLVVYAGDRRERTSPKAAQPIT